MKLMDIAKKLKLKLFVFGKIALGKEKLLYENERYYTLYVSEYLGVDLDNITVFGDQANDKEIFEKAYTKVAVNNFHIETTKPV